MKAHVPGRDYHKRLSLCIGCHVERQLERQGSASLCPEAEETALSNREIFIYWEQELASQQSCSQDCKRKTEADGHMRASQEKWDQ